MRHDRGALAVVMGVTASATLVVVLVLGFVAPADHDTAVPGSTTTTQLCGTTNPGGATATEPCATTNPGSARTAEP